MDYKGKGMITYDEENAILRLTGEFDAGNVDWMNNELRRVCMSLRGPEVQVDLTEVTYLQSCTTAPLLRLGLKALENGIKTVFAIPTIGPVKSITTMYGFSHRFKVVEVAA